VCVGSYTNQDTNRYTYVDRKAFASIWFGLVLELRRRFELVLDPTPTRTPTDAPTGTPTDRPTGTPTGTPTGKTNENAKDSISI